ncbi:MAG: hypothetical protein IAF38_22290 [Bacteroidia bacterium]|nr:hypothetical protein [Bacteroidia bacterium]
MSKRTITILLVILLLAGAALAYYLLEKQTRKDLEQVKLLHESFEKGMHEQKKAESVVIPFIDTMLIRNVFFLIEKNGLLKKNIKILNSEIPFYTVMSPSAMLERFDLTRKGIADDLRLLGKEDQEIILGQLNNGKYFKWEMALTANRIAKEKVFPNYSISVPVFSKDKKIFIVAIEYHECENSTNGHSYLFVTENGKIKRQLDFDLYSKGICKH